MMKHNIEIFDPRLIVPNLAVNERGLEIALGLDFLQKHQNIIEVRAVMPYYSVCSHPVVDPYDPIKYDNLIKKDAEEFNFTDKSVLCISTIEHMGKQDYSQETVIDPLKSIRFLKKILSEAKSFLITWPVGANKNLDAYIALQLFEQNTQNSLFNRNKNTISLYRRINYNPPIWEHTYNPDVIQQTKYNEPFPNGNCLVVIAEQ